MSTAKNILQGSLDMSGFMINSYLGDLTDKDLMRRPAPNANHIAWQIGHLIVSDNGLVNSVCPGAMPDLPNGFAERYTKETAASDDASKFDTKETFLKLMAEQRAALVAALQKVSDAELDKESPERIRQYAPTVGSVFALCASHWVMHSGQWVIVRRQMGLPAQF